MDFAVGVGVFLLAVAFVFAFVPTILAPFTGEDHTQLADRTATTLAGDWLGDPAEPNVLDPDCTVDFFEQFDGGPPGGSDCRFPTGAATLSDAFGLDPATSVNVTVQHPGGGTATVDGVDLEVGRAPTGSASVTTARRVVSLEERTYRLVVRVW